MITVNDCRLETLFVVISRGIQNTRDACEIVNQTIRRALLEPIEIGGLKFRFLAWSNSQLRDHGCYMYADHTNYDNELINVDTIRDWMGDFSAAKSIPKLMSRMGQCFTQAYPTISLRPRDWRLIPDFESDYVDPSNGKNYVFSDGVGRISERMATRIAAIMDLEIVPSCFQIRFKGFKGILVQWPNLLANRFYPDVVFRESQKKFDDSDDETKEILEVVKYSMPSAVCLNRPMIMILDQVSAHQNSKLHLKVTNRITEIFERELDGLGAMLTNDKMAAIQLTTRTTSSIGFQQLAQAGIRLTDEPFFLIDELGYLNPGQVFFQYSPNLCNPSDVCRSFIGPVLISKNPCHVPGDVRLFDAVYVPELSHLRDVVVFPRFAARPHTDEMSGSDLDGDEYTVIFDSDLFIEHNEPPMNFPKAAVVEEEEQVDAPTGIVDFFLKYLDQDAIGRVSNAHLIAADKCGIYDPICERIAAKCSIAVDFPKTGQPADPLDEAERFHETPDFMGANRATYQSQRLLGKLFRKARVLEEILEVVSSESEIESKSDQFLLDEQFELDEPEMFKTAVEIRDFYYAKLQQVLDEYGIESEAEMLSGHALSIRRITEMEKSDYSFYHADRIVEMRWSKIRETFRSEFFEEFGGESMIFQSTPSGAVFIGPERSLVKARCWYSVAYGKHAENKSIQFRSFPWLIWDVLLVARRKQIIRALQLNKTITPTLSVLYPHLNEYVRKFCLTYNDEVKAFVFNLRSLGSFVECFDRYVSNDIYSKCQFDRHHLIAAVLQFGLGIRSSTNQFVKGDYLLPIQVDSLEEANRLEKKYELRETGRFLLEFARFFGSSQISLAQRLDLSFGISPTDRSLVMENVVDWMLVSELSYKTFHHISLCRNFDAFVNKFETLLAS
ncbi:RNA-directed RNA polymerase [Aphelenchoides besseyi]|nr:RNA-directed RNA polymerase [Aphelenchoides besseyi]